MNKSFFSKRVPNLFKALESYKRVKSKEVRFVPSLSYSEQINGDKTSLFDFKVYIGGDMMSGLLGTFHFSKVSAILFVNSYMDNYQQLYS